MPYLTRGAGILGLDVTSIGMMGGNGRVEEPFSNLPCNPYSFAPPGESTCMEFRDGKVLLAPSYTLPSGGWDMILKATAGKAVDWIRDADVLALVNWSELSFSHLLWERTYEHGLKESDCNKHKIAFFDLCDISRKTNQEIDGVLKLIGRYSQKRRTILSLNENEALIIGQALGSAMQQLEKLGKGLRVQYKIDEILIHTRKKSLLLTNRGCYHRETIFVENPKLSTGAGDHFNAASCLGAVMELTEEQRLQFANQYTSLYVTTGKTPTLEQTVMWDEEI